jgi:cytochrome c oxidase subunit 2
MLFNYKLGFQTPSSNVAEGIISFHNDLMFFLTFICIFVFLLLFFCLKNFSKQKVEDISIRMVHAALLEIIWTLFPAIILFVIALPSFSLLYSMDEILEPILSLKVVGHQWYWSYEFIDGTIAQDCLKIKQDLNLSSNMSEGFDSYLLAEEDLTEDSIRLLTVDNHLIIPVEVPSRILVTSADVLHSWAIPTLGVKIDACPGRLNQTSLLIKHIGFYYGQCSEICGVNHGFMPIGIIASSILFNQDKNVYSTLDFTLSGLSSIISDLK